MEGFQSTINTKMGKLLTALLCLTVINSYFIEGLFLKKKSGSSRGNVEASIGEDSSGGNGGEGGGPVGGRGDCSVVYETVYETHYVVRKHDQ